MKKTTPSGLGQLLGFGVALLFIGLPDQVRAQTATTTETRNKKLIQADRT